MFRHTLNCRASLKSDVNPQWTKDAEEESTAIELQPPTTNEEVCTQNVILRHLEAQPLNPKISTTNNIPKNAEVEVTLNLDTYFKWLEIMLWITMGVGIAWALILDFSKATREYCGIMKGQKQDDYYYYPANLLPSLSRSMSSFRIGLAIWTISMAFVFVARLLSTHFMHQMYNVWYEDSILNCIILRFAYAIDVVEIISLIMIPAFSLDCDPAFHSVFFYIFIVLTFLAEIIQYCTRFLRRKTDVTLNEEVLGYYRHIGLLVLLQGFFIAFMISGNLLHKYLCVDYLYSAFALGEYITVIINIRFKRDTIRFVK